jgi:hypothetical protein
MQQEDKQDELHETHEIITQRRFTIFLQRLQQKFHVKLQSKEAFGDETWNWNFS